MFSKSAGDDTVIVVVNVDPHATRETIVHLNMPALGLDWHDSFVVRDEITDQTWTWREHNFVRLDPAHEPAHILAVRTARVTAETAGEAHRAEWFKTAVFYEVLVRSFRDSNGDGTGDFQGLTEKLDYLAWLGVDCLWVPPFFTSPLRDGGYDVADYTGILPEAGTVEDFRAFVDAAHERGLRVIIDFVMNHTSDAHPWFQASRSDPDGPYGDFYVWSDTDDLYEDARIIFVDTEPSNWTWDPVRQQYFWHRFFSHQPDLNFDNPQVHEAMFEALSFWLDMGLDGFRLDAVPYLYERPGTNGENLPETHAFLRDGPQLHRHTPTPDGCSLAEANQWPADVVDYFGAFDSGGDECHMCFHFPVMPRIFMAVRRESRYPISEILEQTPAIPDGCQWGIFLRNHDELTLEMVTDEDRDYMWDEYAKDPRMKANIGIRRRLAPLLDNDTNQIELFTALLLSLPGFAGALLRRRDRDGRQHLARRPRRRPHPHAVDAGPQRRVLLRQPGPAAPAAGPGPGVRLPGRQRRGPAVERFLVAALDPADDPRSSAAHGVRAGHLLRPGRLQPQRAVLRAGARRGRRRDPVRQQPLPIPPARRARPAALGGPRPRRAARRSPVPGRRRAALPADGRRLRLLLVPPDHRPWRRPPRDRPDHLPQCRALVRRQGPPLPADRRVPGRAGPTPRAGRPAGGCRPGDRRVRRRRGRLRLLPAAPLLLPRAPGAALPRVRRHHRRRPGPGRVLPLRRRPRPGRDGGVADVLLPSRTAPARWSSTGSPVTSST